MAMVDMQDLLDHAYRNRYAVGAFEVVSLDFLRAIIEAAEQSRSPVILNLVEAHFDLFDVDLLMAAVLRAARRAGVPVAVHFDHCSSPASVQEAIRLGCNSVMFDAADESFPVNVDNTRCVAELTHACGIPLEGELGYVAGIAQADADAEPASIFTSVNEAKAYVERTGVNFLAISIGTVHGRTKSKARLDFNRLARINEAVGIPLVIHGGTGLSDDQYHKLIDHGVAKINFFTALAELTVRQLRDNLAQGEIPYRRLFTGVHESFVAEVQRCMQVWGSAGRAAEVLMQCRAWDNIERVMVHGVSPADPELILDLLSKGQQDLATIPGVLEVRIGRSLTALDKQPRYCWIIRFAHPRAIDSYTAHPLYNAYTGKHFTPYVTDLASDDYAIIDSAQLPQSPPHIAERIA